MSLSDTKIRNEKAGDKPKKLYDTDGLFLLVTSPKKTESKPKVCKWWRFKYRFGGKEKSLSFGTYPEVSLIEAREKRDAARKQVAAGIDPGEVRKASKVAQNKDETTFEVVAREWYAKNEPVWSAGHAVTVKVRLERDVYPKIGNIPIAEIDTQNVLWVLRHVEARGALDTAYRIKVIIGQIFRYAVVTGRAAHDPSAPLKPKEVLQKREEKHHAAITDPKQVALLLRAIDNYQGSFIVKCALQLAPLLFVRPGELQKAEWSEINLETAEWEIPESRMKMKKAHLVPVPIQALDILKALHPLTGHSRYVFPGRTSSRPMSSNTLNAALRYLGFDKDTATAHGFRAMARTILDEVLQVRVDYIEHQLAHSVKDPNGRAYNRTAHLVERRKMMQLWADYLDGLKAGAQVIPFRRAV